MEPRDSTFSRFRDPKILAALLFLTVAVVFLPALKNDFISYDDPQFVTENPIVQAGWTWAGFKWAFTAVVQANWHPVTLLSHLTDCELFGLRPWGHHLVNVLLHALNAALVFTLLRRMTGAMWRSLFAAAFFGLHPLRVESVAWVAERKDVLSAAFFLLTLLAWRRYATLKRRGAYAAALVCFALGLMSKAMLVTAPFVLLLLDYWPLRRFQTEKISVLLLEKIPFALLTAIFCFITLGVQRAHGAVASSEQFSFATRASNALVSYVRYLGMTFYPGGLALPYPYVKHWPAGLVAGAALGLATATASVIVLARRRPYAAVGWFWFLGTLVPVIGLVQVGEQALADRYTYIPGIGLAILLTWAFYDLFAAARPRRFLSIAAAAICLTVCAVLTQRQLGCWQSSETLFRHTLTVTRNNATAMGLLADALAARGDDNDALALYEKAAALPLASEACRNNYGLLLLRHGKVKLAIAQFDAAAAHDPQGARARLNEGLRLQAQGLTNQAAAQFRQAQALNQNDAVVENNLGVMCAQQGELAQAAEHFHRALLLKPMDGSAWANLGQIALRQGVTNEARADFNKALELDPTLTFAREQLQKLGPAISQ